MGTTVMFILFLMIASRRPDIALMLYFVHWTYCRAVGSQTMFDRIEAAFKRAIKAMNEEPPK